MFTKWKNACILFLIISFCIVGFASAAHGDGNGSKMGQKFKSQLVETKAKSLPEPSGMGTSGNPYVFETCVVYQFWGPLHAWTDGAFESDDFERGEIYYLSDCPMAGWAKVQAGYSEDECLSTGEEAYFWGGYYEGSFSSPAGLSTGKHWYCWGTGYSEFYYIVNEQSPPEASFTFTPTSGYVPLTVAFTDTSTGSPASWLWDFGDGNTSTEQNPVHVYTSPGIFYVSLTVSNCGGSDTETKSDFITGTNPVSPPIADFTGTPRSGSAPLTVQFTDTSTGSPTSWSWSFGDGETSTLQNPSHEYDSADDYTVSLTATNSGGSDTEIKSGYIEVLEIPVAAHNYDFINYYDLTTTPAAENASNAQALMGYSSSYQTNANAFEAYSNLYDDAIFYFNGHGISQGGIVGGGIYFYNNSYIVGNNITYPGQQCAIDQSNDIDDVLLVVYNACYTATYSSLNGNLADETIAKGVDYVIGFSGHIGNDKSNYWGEDFWERVKNGESITEAATHAQNDAFQNAWIPYTNDGIDTMVILGDDPDNTYLQPARYGNV